jgi:uncharacterized protein (DUF2225 family)
MTNYKNPNPMFYDMWLCKLCGYAAMASKFNNITSKQILKIRENITSKWVFDKQYPDVYDVDTAIEVHLFGLLNSVIKEATESERALISLKIAWLNRIKKDNEKEKLFLKQAQVGFIKAFQEENCPIAGMDEPTLEYLVGEISRRIEDYQSALYWFGKVLVSRSAKEKLKDMAREQKNLIPNNE